MSTSSTIPSKTFSRVVGINLLPDTPTTRVLSITIEYTTKISNGKRVPHSSCNETFFERVAESVLEKWVVVKNFTLREINPVELIEIRLNKSPGVVYKKDNQLFYSPFSGEFNLGGKEDNLGEHLCACDCSMVCRGCPRTAALTVAYQQRIGCDFYTSVKNSWRIEKYTFVHEGIETFNMDTCNEAFIVLKCDNYQKAWSSSAADKLK